MGKFWVFVSAAFVLLSFPAGSDALNVSACRNLLIPNTLYVLNQSIINNSLAGNCIIISAPNITFDCQGYSIRSDDEVAGIYSNKVNTTIKNCYISMSHSSYKDYGIGIKLQGADNSHLFNNILNDQFYGLVLYSTSNTRIENLITNSNTVGIDIVIRSNNNSLINVVSNSNSVNGFSIQISSNNNIIDSDLSGNKRDVWLGGGSKNNVFLNVNYDISKEGVQLGGELIRKWYYRAHVVDSQSTGIANATVGAYNVNNELILNLTTNESGWTPIGSLIDYVNSGGIRTYYSDYNIIANFNELQDSHYYDVTAEQNNLNDIFIFVLSGLPGDVDGNCKVDIFDLAAVGLAYGSKPGDSNWNENADLTGDGKVNIFDLATFGLNYGRIC